MAFEWNWNTRAPIRDDEATRRFYNSMPRQDNRLVNKYGAIFDPSNADQDDVEIMQRQLGVNVDGIWGKQSQKAYNKYMQNQMGVTADGVWGKQSQAAYDAGYYNPEYVAYQQALEQATIANNERLAQDKIAALQDEYNRNEARIAEIESKIASLKGQISDNAKRRDQLDMQLAANRAGIGDIGNAIAHQNAIETRKQQEFTRRLELARQKGTASDAEKAVIDAYTELAYAPDEKTQKLAQFKVNQALEKYQKATGKPYGANPLDTPLGGAKAGDVATTLERAQGKFSASFDKNGRPTAAAKAEALKDAEGLPYTKELQEWIDKVRNSETQEERAGKDAKVSKANQAAVDEVAKEVTGFDMKEGDTKEITASNKKKVTVKKSGGKLTFTCGKAVKTK